MTDLRIFSVFSLFFTVFSQFSQFFTALSLADRLKLLSYGRHYREYSPRCLRYSCHCCFATAAVLSVYGRHSPGNYLPEKKRVNSTLYKKEHKFLGVKKVISGRSSF